MRQFASPQAAVCVVFFQNAGYIPHFAASRPEKIIPQDCALVFTGKRRVIHYPEATSIQQKSRSAPLADFPLQRKLFYFLFCWDFAFLIAKFFSQPIPFPCAGNSSSYFARILPAQ